MTTRRLNSPVPSLLSPSPPSMGAASSENKRAENITTHKIWVIIIKLQSSITEIMTIFTLFSMEYYSQNVKIVNYFTAVVAFK